MKPFLLGVLFLFAISARAQYSTSTLVYGGNTIGYFKFLPADYSPVSAHKFPLIISLGGIGERGHTTTDFTALEQEGLPYLITNGATMHFSYGGQQESFLVLAPLLDISFGNWQNFYIDAMINYAKTNLNVDPNRIFLSGYSLGGGGCWKYATSSAAAAQNLAGIAPIAGSPDYTTLCNIAQNKVAVWAFHATDDGDVAVHFTTDAINGINSCSPQVPARARIYPDGDHSTTVWRDRAYDTTNYWQYPNVFQWMMKVSRTLDPATNLAPVANAGPTTVNLTVPAMDKDIILNGISSTDADDIISEYRWRQLSGPLTTHFLSTTGYSPIDSSIRPGAVVSIHTNDARPDWITAGDYVFKFTVLDYKSAPSTSTITFHVTLPATPKPGAFIYNDSVVLSPTQTSVFLGTTVKNYATTGSWLDLSWQQLSGPASLVTFSPDNDANGSTVGNITTPGTYKVVFSAMDHFSHLIGSDTTTIVKQGAALPVTWLYFKGESISGHTLLNWATGAESNSDHFDVQRSADGAAYTTIGSVTATGAANGSAYTFTDADAPKGKSYYRLKQVDKDGRAVFSAVITISNTGRGYAIETYPNPAKDNLSVSVNGNLYGNLQVMITDMQGRIVRQQLWTKTQVALTKNIDLIGLQSGLYQLILISPDGKKEATGFVKY